MHQEKAREEFGMKLGGAHGGAVARLTDGRPSPAEKGREMWRGSFTELVRCSCVRREGERWSGEGVSTGAELSGELGRAPASDSRERGAYHGKAT